MDHQNKFLLRVLQYNIWTGKLRFFVVVLFEFSPPLKLATYFFAGFFCFYFCWTFYFFRGSYTCTIQSLWTSSHRSFKMYITTWNKWQSKFLFSGKEVFVPWKIENKIYQRYYYLFNYFEFKELLKKYFKIESSKGIFEKNIELIVKNN